MNLLPGGISSWHCHQRQTDIIVAVRGQLRIGMYDDRSESASDKSFGMLNISVSRPTAIRLPPLVWHAIKNPSGDDAAYVVVND